MTINDKLYDVAAEMASQLEEMCACADQAGSPMPDVNAILEAYYQVRNAWLLTVAAKQVCPTPVKDNTPPLHQVMGIEKCAGVNLIVPITTATTHKGETYYQRKALA